MSTVVPPSRIVFSLGPWDGPSARTLIQGVKWTGKSFIIGQADNVSGQRLQNLVFREHDENFKFTGRTCTVVSGGHGSSFGVELQADGSVRIYFGHATKGFGYVTFVDGKGTFVPVSGVPNGDWTICPEHNLACVRVGTRYRGYTWTSVKASKPKLIFDKRIYNWGKRFQGHYITRGKRGNILLYVHRDYKTKGSSRLDVFRIIDNKLETLRKISTTGMGDEAEGAMDYKGWTYGVKRTGNTGAGRIVECRRTPYTSIIEPPAPKPPVNPAAGTWIVTVDKGTFLWGVPVNSKIPRSQWKQRDPGFKITTGVNFVVRKDSSGKTRQYLVTKAGWMYATEFLKKVK